MHLQVFISFFYFHHFYFFLTCPLYLLPCLEVDGPGAGSSKNPSMISLQQQHIPSFPVPVKSLSILTIQETVRLYADQGLQYEYFPSAPKDGKYSKKFTSLVPDSNHRLNMKDLWFFINTNFPNFKVPYITEIHRAVGKESPEYCAWTRDLQRYPSQLLSIFLFWKQCIICPLDTFFWVHFFL